MIDTSLNCLKNPHPDLQLILTQHRIWLESDGKSGARAELRGIDLQGVDLSHADLRAANLNGANLRRANLHWARLEDAKLIRANLEEATLSNANLSGSNLQEAKLTKANLEDATIVGANLIRAEIRQANLRGANASASNFQSADLEGASLEGANLSATEFQRATLRGASLQKINAQEADFYRADLHAANLQEVDFENTMLAEANLEKTDLSAANLRGTDARGVNLQNVDLSYFDLRSIDLSGATLQRARLLGADFQEAKLVGADLREANLTDANLKGADLRSAKLQGAELQRINLQNSILTETKLQESNLQDADLTNAKGLCAGQLAGADVSNTKLSAAISSFDTLKVVEESSKFAQHLFLSILLGCVYSWLTIATTLDVRLLTNSATSPLPVIQTTIPIVGFYWIAPILLLLLNIYLHLYLQRLWENMADLPAIFPDGKPLDKKIHPWLLNGLVRSHLKLLNTQRPALFQLQRSISTLLAWWIVPATLLLFWVRYLPKHDWPGTILHIFLFSFAIGVGTTFYNLAAMTLKGMAPDRYYWYSFSVLKSARYYLVEIGIALLLIILARGAINGIKPTFNLENRCSVISGGMRKKIFPDMRSKPSYLQLWIPQIFVALGYSPYADFDAREVSIKPANWKPTDNPDLVSGAPLAEKNLRYLSARNAFMVKADLRRADIEGSALCGADLRQTDLSFANLYLSDLTGANLSGANMSPADLREANLSGANLSHANLQQAKLYQAILSKADLTGASLRFAILQNANLSGAKLKETNLVGANLRSVNLYEADFEGAKLNGADLTGANLRRARNLTKEQIMSAFNYEKALSDSTIDNLLQEQKSP